jgi:hypothetical protein
MLEIQTCQDALTANNSSTPSEEPLMFLHEHKVVDSIGTVAVLRHVSTDDSADDSLTNLRFHSQTEYTDILSTLGNELFDVFGSTIEHVKTTPITIGGAKGTLAQLSNKVVEGGFFLWSLDVLD